MGENAAQCGAMRGRKQLLNGEDKQHIRQCIDETPDITLAELRTKLGLKASIQTLGRVVRAIGSVSKRRSMSASEQERPRCAEGTYRLARIRLGKNRRITWYFWTKAASTLI